MTGSGWREARERKGLTLRGLATLAGLSPPFLSDIEHGRRRFSPEAEDRVRSILDLPPREPEPEARCVVCETPLSVKMISVYDPSTGPMIIGPRSAGQFRQSTKITCPRCGLVYAHKPRPATDNGGNGR